MCHRTGSNRKCSWWAGYRAAEARTSLNPCSPGTSERRRWAGRGIQWRAEPDSPALTAQTPRSEGKSGSVTALQGVWLLSGQRFLEEVKLIKEEWKAGGGGVLGNCRHKGPVAGVKTDGMCQQAEEGWCACHAESKCGVLRDWRDTVATLRRALQPPAPVRTGCKSHDLEECTERGAAGD